MRDVFNKLSDINAMAGTDKKSNMGRNMVIAGVAIFVMFIIGAIVHDYVSFHRGDERWSTNPDNFAGLWYLNGDESGSIFIRRDGTGRINLPSYGGQPQDFTWSQSLRRNSDVGLTRIRFDGQFGYDEWSIRTRGDDLRMSHRWRNISYTFVSSGPSVPSAAQEPTAAPLRHLLTTTRSDCWDFSISLFSERDVYNTTEAVQLWAELTYQGHEDQVTIWHGAQFIVFSIMDGDGFSIEHAVSGTMESAVLQYRMPYRFYLSASYDEELFLPKGEYTVAVTAMFSTDEAMEEIVAGLDTAGSVTARRITVEE